MHSDGTSRERRKATLNQCKESGCICGGREEQQRSELLTRELSVHGPGSLGAASDAGEAAGESFTIQLFFSFENFSVEGLPTKKLHLTEMFSFEVSIRQLQISWKSKLLFASKREVETLDRPQVWLNWIFLFVQLLNWSQVPSPFSLPAFFFLKLISSSFSAPKMVEIENNRKEKVRL